MRLYFLMSYFIRRIVKWFLKNLYGPLAWGYETVAHIVSFGQWHNWNYQISSFLNRDEKILEVGIGTGMLHKRLLIEGYQIFGCDLSSQMLNLSGKKIKHLKKKLIRADNLQLPFSNHSFQKIIATFPSDYVFSNQFWREYKRLLTHDGEMIILLSVLFGKNNFINNFYHNLYKITGQSIEKEKVEPVILDLFKAENDVKIFWFPYKKVELCLLVLKNK